MAEWCLVTEFPPSVYKELTRDERDEFYRRAVKLKGYKSG